MNGYRFRRLSPDTAHYFFGYYDRDPWDETGTRHLAVEAPQCDALPAPGETARLGYFELRGQSEGSPNDPAEFVPCVETRAWCHQQGAMQQWMGPGRFIYNDFDVDASRLVSRVYGVGDGVGRAYDKPIYTLSPDRGLAVCLDFSRIPRRGYSYADAPVPAGRHPDLDRDGLFVMDLESGEARLAASYRRIVEAYPLPYELGNRYWWLNHAEFNRASDRIQFLFRHADSPTGASGWSTTMFTVGADGCELRCILPNVYWSGKISHQLWGRTADELLVDANWRDRGHEYVVMNDAPAFRASLISPGLGPAGHLVFSPDGTKLLADTYPKDGIQTLAMVDAATGEVQIIGTFRHHRPDGALVDTRCDLHPRWSADGTMVSVDSIDTGHRGIYVCSL